MVTDEVCCHCFASEILFWSSAIGADMCIYILALNILLRLAQRWKPIKSSNSRYWIMNGLCLSSKKMCAGMCHFLIDFQGKFNSISGFIDGTKSVSRTLIWNASGNVSWTTRGKRIQCNLERNIAYDGWVGHQERSLTAAPGSS